MLRQPRVLAVLALCLVTATPRAGRAQEAEPPAADAGGATPPAQAGAPNAPATPPAQAGAPGAPAPPIAGAPGVPTTPPPTAAAPAEGAAPDAAAVPDTSPQTGAAPDALSAEPTPTPQPQAAPAPAPQAPPPDAAAAPPAETPPAIREAGAIPTRDVVSAAPAVTSAPIARPRLSPPLYVRLAAGIGFPFGRDVADGYASLGSDRVSFAGLAFASDLMVGTHLTDWIAIGGGVISDTITSGKVEERDGNAVDLEKNLYFAMLGPFIDIYPAAPAGFHVQALLGFAHLSRARNLGDEDASGPGGALAVGYEWRASPRWNVGVLGRLAVAPLAMDPVDGVERSPAFYEPTVLISATMQP